jgi:hypothetical protein
VEKEGYCLVYLEVVDDVVAFARDDAADRVPPGYVVYTRSELVELYGKPRGTAIRTFRLLHEVKRLGGRVVRRRNGSSGLPGPTVGGDS